MQTKEQKTGGRTENRARKSMA